MNVKKTAVISCAVLAVDIRHAAKKLKMDMDFRFLEGGLHENPEKLRQKLQAAIDNVSASGDYERIVVGYGVCGRGTVGIQAREIPLAIPRVHDCIALFLGGNAVYQKEFKKYPGTYYISAGWYEEKTEPLSQREQQASFGGQRLEYAKVARDYGDKAARETFRFLNSWQKNYQRAAFIETGAKTAPKYEAHARRMAEKYGWAFEKIAGDPALIEKALTAKKTTSDILVVPPGHVIDFDPMRSALSANPVWEAGDEKDETTPQTTLDIPENVPQSPNRIKIGLGIDAGGTYTDTVIYDLETGTTLCKSKALTTKWDFTKGIAQSMAGLDPDSLEKVEMVALSTTLATNAIVEGEGQKVGMILMPPYGLFTPEDIPYSPKALVSAQLEITGNEITPLDEKEVAQVVRDMVEKENVKAFAVSGFAGAINPSHELAIKAIIRKETGLFATCGHELSDTMDFTVRANTAMLNARIIPRLTRLIRDLETVLEKEGIDAPIVVVKGDGSLMSSKMAKQKPVETILSGPAASVAGARFLTGLEDALVVDMGGTTTDTARVKEGLVSVCNAGSNVGGHKTHVKALEIRTRGLGGDSMIQWEKSDFSIGPRRVAPVSWLGTTGKGAYQALLFLENHVGRYKTSSKAMQILALTGSPEALDLTPMEKKVVQQLSLRPHSIDELIHINNVYLEMGLELNRLEENFVIQRCGLTPTDLLHLKGQFRKWDIEMADRFCRLMSAVSKTDIMEMVDHLLNRVSEQLTLELLKREMDDEIDPEAIHTCPVCQNMIQHLLSENAATWSMDIHFKQPIVGIGAPISYFLPKAAKALGTRAILPDDADVANAIGAITSSVLVKHKVRIVPGPEGGFLIQGIADSELFDDFQEADAFARKELTRRVRDLADIAGTSERAVELTTEDQMPAVAGGKKIFLGRVIRAKIKGRPDQVSTNPTPVDRAAYGT